MPKPSPWGNKGKEEEAEEEKIWSVEHPEGIEFLPEELELLSNLSKQTELFKLTVSRKGGDAYDILYAWDDLKGFKGRSWLPLAVIKAADWTDKRIWGLTDAYGQKGLVPPQGHDWSGVRDSSVKAIWEMFWVAKSMKGW